MTRQKFTILIADDDLDDHELMRRGLSECKITIKTFSVYNGVHVMDYLLRRHSYKFVDELPDLVLLDLNMPLMDGFETLKEIRKHPALINLPVYVITTSRSPADYAKAIELGAHGFYSKGSRSKDILNIMKEVCQECFEDLPAIQKDL
jgi:CheY-like chemotaxis protein